MKNITYSIRSYKGVSDFQKGFTLIEILIVIVIAGILMGVAGEMVQTSERDSEVARAKGHITQIQAAASKYCTSRGSCSSVSMAALDSRGLPDSIGTGAGSNPWSGNYTITANTSNPRRHDIALTEVPSEASLALQDQYSQTASVTISSGTLTISFN